MHAYEFLQRYGPTALIMTKTNRQARCRSWQAYCLIAGLVFFSAVAGADEAADPEIEYLLEFVARSACTFHRNGEDHSSVDAADHLRLKYRRGKKYANSAEQYIDRLASKSSWSGEFYTVTCDGQTRTSSAWLHEALREHRLNTP